MQSNHATLTVPIITDLSIIIVSWNVWDLLRAALTSIEQASRASSLGNDVRYFGPASLGDRAPTLEVVVVDNASADATAELLPARFPWVRFIRSATNLGFPAGNNIGYATSRGRTIYFLNPDTELVNAPLAATGAQDGPGDSLWTLYRALMDNPTIGMVGPQLRYGDNSLQDSRRRFPTFMYAVCETDMLGRYWRNNPWRRAYHMKEWPATIPQDADWLSGAAMLARRDALEQIRQPEFSGPFDEGFFMYSEEVDLCKRLKDAGWRIVYIPQATVIHYEGQSSGQVVTARYIYHYRSQIRYHKKHFGQGQATLLHLIILVNLSWQLLIEACKWLVGHKRGLRAARVQSYRQILAADLRAA